MLPNTFDFEESDPSEKNKVFELDNGTKINATQKDPYGFWTLSYSRGPIPDMLKGQYTTFEYAKVAVKDYCNTNGHKLVFVKAKNEPKLEDGATKSDIYDPPKPRFKKTHDQISLEG